MAVYYNENDPEKVAALKAMMAAGHIASGEIDESDIRDVNPAKLSAFTQCHFFAGIGLWQVAARAAGISDDFPLWSGSCPCQPFSSSGSREGLADDRHLWPHWFWLIAQQRPLAIVGEQVASKDGLAWLDIVCADMEGSNYSGGAIDLCSAGFGAPNIRQRLYMCWLNAIAGIDRVVELGDSEREGLERHGRHVDDEAGWQPQPAGSVAKTGDAGRLASTDSDGQQQGRLSERQGRSRQASPVEFGNGQGDSDRGKDRHSLPNPTNGFWADADWLLCRDIEGPKIRPVERGTFCLAAGHSGRAEELRAYGDAINLQVAIEFLAAVKDDIMKGWQK